ncbi:MAG: lysine--tRNA ligase [Acidobacteriota bacterium]
MSDAITDPVQQRHRKLEQIRSLGYDVHPHRYALTHSVGALVETFSAKTGDELSQETVRLKTAGRIMSMRGHGKVGFSHIAGGGRQIQVYVRQDRVGPDNYRLYKLLDTGDIIGVKGELFRTRRGELTVFADEVNLLSKSLLPLPEKWHGLSDVEIRYRQRYLDLIVSPQVRRVFVRRSRIIRELRRFLEAHDYLEVETPIMQPLAGGARARPFETFHQALGMPLFLRIAPELYLKRLTVGGFDRVYEISRNFRNEGISTQHNPEFTMLEFYVAYCDYRDLMDFSESMLSHVVEKVNGGLEVDFGKHRISFENFARYSMLSAIQEFWSDGAAPSEEELCDENRLRQLLRRLDAEAGEGEAWGKLLALLFEVVAEEHLIQPTFIYDYPAEVSPLSKRKDEDPRFVERFELYIGGLEIANAYSELNDPEEQQQRFEEQLRERDRGELEAHVMDEDYLRALRYGMPPTAGEGVGIDRLTMILTNSRSIREVILFPQLRPESQK